MKKQNKLLAEFMGFQKVRIGYYGGDDETEFQMNHRKWLDKVGLESVGTYIVNLKTNKWFEWQDVSYHKSWDWLIPVANKVIKIYTGNFEIVQKELQNDESFIARMAAKHMFEISSVLGQLEMESVYLKCFDFIQWYFKIQTTPEPPQTVQHAHPTLPTDLLD